MPVKNTLICTVGTSLLSPNLSSLPTSETYDGWLAKQPLNDQAHLTRNRILTLADATRRREARDIAQVLREMPGTTRLCGAEINSIADLFGQGEFVPDARLCFFHSDTDDGRHVATILKHYYEGRGHTLEINAISDLQDQDPKRFRTKGLRNLAKTVCRIILERGAPYCAMNATGGYKAQIAIAVMMGQALSVPVFYKHERFSEIITFPPMPISMDHALWMRYSGLLNALDRDEILAKTMLDGTDWDEHLETLVESVEIDGAIHLELSPTGQIFHDSFQGRFASERDQYLPPAVVTEKKSAPRLDDHSWGNARGPILAFMQRMLDDCPYVKGCRTHYWNPNLSRASLFRALGEEIEGVFSNGSWTVKLIVETSATTEGQRAACLADLNARIKTWKS